MDITQTFYDSLASKYDRLFEDWNASVDRQAAFLLQIFQENGFDASARILDCACGIGTQAVGLASLGYDVTGSDISDGELAEAAERAEQRGVKLRTVHADFRALGETFSGTFDIVIAMDNALPHMLTRSDLEAAVRSIAAQVRPDGLIVIGIRDYDTLLKEKPPYSPPYIHRTAQGQRVSFQTWVWEGDCYSLTQYIIEDEGTLQVSKFECGYRAVRRAELTELFQAAGCRSVRWKLPEETGFYQPVAVVRK